MQTGTKHISCALLRRFTPWTTTKRSQRFLFKLIRMISRHTMLTVVFFIGIVRETSDISKYHVKRWWRRNYIQTWTRFTIKGLRQSFWWIITFWLQMIWSTAAVKLFLRCAVTDSTVCVWKWDRYVAGFFRKLDHRITCITQLMDQWVIRWKIAIPFIHSGETLLGVSRHREHVLVFFLVSIRILLYGVYQLAIWLFRIGF